MPRATTKKSDDKPEAEPLQGEVVSDEPKHDEPATSEVVKVQGSAPLIGGLISTDDLRKALSIQTEQRAIVKEFIQDNLVNGVDFGSIHVVSYDKCKDQERCTKDYHYSKAVLFKPGQEKLFSLFQITDKLERDDETYQMLPGIPGLVAYKCTLYRNGQEIGHGRGSATVGDKRRDANATIKIAEKRARMDACLSLGFSEYFAQDLDDPDYKNQADMANERARAQAEARDTDDLGLLLRDAKLPVDNDERVMLTRLLKQAGIEDWTYIIELLKSNGIDPQAMTSGQARTFMRALISKQLTYPPDPTADTIASDDTDVDAALSAAEHGVKSEPAPEPVSEAELVIDDELKANVEELYKSLGLNARGKMWFKKYVTGRPYGELSSFTDADWRKAFDFVQDILDERVTVQDQYIEGVIPNEEEES